MSTDPLDRYQSMMHDTHVPAHLSDQVLEQARVRLAADKAESAAASCGARETGATRSPLPSIPAPAREATASPVFSVKRSRMKGFALAACTVLALGLGGTAIALGLPGLVGNGEAEMAATPSFADLFGLKVAEAAEIGQSVELSADESGITFAGTGGYNMRFSMNLTCNGEGIKHLAYTINGGDVSFMSLDMSQDALHPDMESPERFEVDYDNQNPEGLHREILVNMADPAMMELSQQMAELSEQRSATEDPDKRAAIEAQWRELNARDIELNNAYYKEVMDNPENNNAWITSKVTAAAQKLANATLSITATFTDGTTTTKNYRIAPVDGFEEKFLAYQTIMMMPDHDEADPALTTPLFTITEVA